MQSNSGKALKFSLLLSIAILIISTTFTSAAFAAEDIQMKVNTGFNGEYKSAQWVPIKISVTNNGDKDFEGNLIIEVAEDRNYAATYHLPATLAKKTTKEFTMSIPGQGISPVVEVKLLNANNVEVIKSTLGGRVFPENTYFIGILASDKDTANFLGSFSKDSFSYPTRVVSLEQKDIPSTTYGLKGMDMLLINNYSLDTLSDQQKAAISQWTKEGGLLALAGGAQYFKLGNQFNDISPVNVTDTVKIDNLPSLEKAVNKQLLMINPLTISNATLKNGSIIYEENDIPIFAINKVNAGHVLYIAYDLAEEPLASWAGNRELWSDLLSNTLSGSNPKGNLQMANNMWSIKAAADRIPSLELPNFRTLFSLFIAYIFIIGPVIYFALKKAGKRDWNWVIIPFIAMLAAASVFQLASLNRSNNIMAHNVSVIKINDNGIADQSSVTAIFVPKGGDYSLGFKNVDLVLPANDNIMNAKEAAKSTWISILPNKTNIQFKNVEFWSLRKVLTEKKIEDAGSFDMNLQYLDGKIVGSITNKTKYHLKDVKYFDGSQIENIGDLQVGSSVEINIPYQPGSTKQYGIPVDQLLPNHLQNRNFNYDSRESQLLQVLNDYNYYNSSLSSPMLLGWTEEQLVDVELSKESDDYNIGLVMGYLSIQPAEDGSIFYPPGIIKANLINSSNLSTKLESYEDGYRFAEGSLEFDFNVKNDEVNLAIERVQLFIWSYDNATFDQQIYNWKEQEFVQFHKVLSSNNELFGAAIDSYISPQGAVKIKITNITNRYNHLGQPAISVEGKVME